MKIEIANLKNISRDKGIFKMVIKEINCITKKETRAIFSLKNITIIILTTIIITIIAITQTTNISLTIITIIIIINLIMGSTIE